MRIKYLLLIPIILLTGCLGAVADFFVGNEESLATLGDAATAVAGPYGALGALGVTTLVGLSKWYRHKKDFKETVAYIQAAKADLSPAALDKLHEGLNSIMPDALKAKIDKIKESL